jgi:hypothetical protein
VDPATPTPPVECEVDRVFNMCHCTGAKDPPVCGVKVMVADSPVSAFAGNCDESFHEGDKAACH